MAMFSFIKPFYKKSHCTLQNYHTRSQGWLALEVLWCLQHVLKCDVVVPLGQFRMLTEDLITDECVCFL
jgi:hypothetical protein